MNSLPRKLIPLVLAAAMWAAAGWQQEGLNRARAGLGLTLNRPLENAPPMLAFTTVALGGFRGIIANFLWIRANELQVDGKHIEIIQLADWITKLQPRSPATWRYHSWNMTYNVAIKFSDPADRWRWVRRGIELLRDEGLAYNPRSAELHHELGWFFQHKLGNTLDDAHRYYKTAWLAEMVAVLGPDGNYSNLLDPGTEDERRRAALLRDTYKLDPLRMKRIDERFGPLEWRLPEAHAIYWAVAGLELGDGQGQLPLRRLIWQSMQMAFLRGRLIRVPGTKQAELGPNLPLLEKANGAYEQMMAEQPDRKEAMTPGHINFLREAIFLLYVNNRMAEANAWYRKLATEYPQGVQAGQSLEEFAITRMEERLEGGNVDRVRATLEVMIERAYGSLALGEADEHEALQRLALLMWQRHQARFAGQEERLGLPPLPQIRQIVRDRLLGPQSTMLPQLQAQLRTALNLPAATNAPAVVPK
jgi:hypothetical protein